MVNRLLSRLKIPVNNGTFSHRMWVEKNLSVEIFGDTVVSRYVKALYEVSAGRESEFLRQLQAVRNAIESLDNREKLFKRFSLLPKDGDALVRTLIQELELLPEIGNFLKLVLSNKRFSAILEICEVYEKFYDHMTGKKIFHVTYANNFSEQSKSELSKHMQELFGENIEFVVHQDTSLIDGLQIRYGSKILDYSMKSKLERLKKSIKGKTAA